MTLTETEKQRLINGIRATFAIPFIDGIEDYVWEAVFAYMKELPILDPLTDIRSKLLFDVLDARHKIGWSCKALEWIIAPGCEFELVIQRADIFKKAKQLGYDVLTLSTHTDQLGEALLRHWYTKANKDADAQNIEEKRIAILIKTKQRMRFAYYEGPLAMLAPKELRWEWTDATKTGLQGKRKKDGFCVYRWYPNQKQFFERFVLPKSPYIFEVKPQRLPVKEMVELLLSHLTNKS